MPFNYQSLKNLTNSSFVSASIDTADIAGLTVTAGKIADSAVIAAKLATGAVNTTAGTVTGVLPVAKGGLATNSFAGAYRAFFSNGSVPTAGLHGIASLQVYTSSTTWTRPSGVRYIRVQLVGSGGGGSGHGEGGGAGGYAERYLDVTGISSVGITIDGGGGGTYYANAGGNAGGSSFGPYIWMYEQVITATQTVTGIGSYFGYTGSCRFFIYDSGTTSTVGMPGPVNRLYDSGPTQSSITGYFSHTGFTLSVNPGFYFVGVINGNDGNGTVGCYARNIRSSLGWPSLGASGPYIGYGLGYSLGGSSSCLDWYTNGLPSIIAGSVSVAVGFSITGTPPPMYLRYS